MSSRPSSNRTRVQSLVLALMAIATARASQPSPLQQSAGNPILSYSTFWGGNGYDAANAIAVDAAGNVYITGQNNSVDFSATNHALPTGGAACASSPEATCFDVFVTKFSPTGAVVYSVTFGGSEDDRGTGIAVDAAGNAYITGITNSADFPTANALQANLKAGNCGPSFSPLACYDSFVAKLNPSGDSLVYSTFIGGSGQDLAAGIALDSSGEATVAGTTSSHDFPTSVGAPRGSFAGGTLDAFVTRLDSTGSRAVFSTYLGGSDEDRGLAVAVNAAGETIVAGSTASSDFPAVRGVQMRNAGGSCGSATSPVRCTDAFVARLNASGTELTYSTYLGGTGSDTANAIAVDSEGAAYVAGSTTSTNFPTTPGSFQRTGGGTSVDAFVAKLNPDGSPLVYSTYLGGLGQEEAYGIAVDSSGIALVTGYVNGSGFPLVSSLQNSSGKFYDVFISKLNAAGSSLIFSSLLGGSGNEAGQGIGVDTAGNSYVAGWTFSTDFPTALALQPSYVGGSYDAFVAKLSGLKLPVAELSETAVNFAGQGIGTSSALQKVTLTNGGEAPLSVASIAVSGEFIESSDCPAALSSGAVCTISVASNPETLGPQVGAVSVVDNAWGSPHVITLNGNGLPSPVASFSPGSLDFQSQLVGATSPAQTVMLSNPGSVTLEIASVKALGDFSQTNNCGNSILSGGHCTIQVSFSPQSAGTSTGQISVTDNAPGSPQIVLLTGVGTGPALSLSATSLTFANQQVGTTSAPQSVIVTSAGTMALTISSLTASGDYAVTHDCPRQLAPGATCTIRVTFSPSARGLRTGSVMIADNAAHSPQAIALSAMVVVPVAGLSRSSVNFGEQGLMTSSPPEGVVLSNSGIDPLSVSRIAASGDFRQSNNCMPLLAPGENCEIQMVFAPTGAGTRSGTLIIADNALDSPQTVALAGTGVTAFSLQAAPNQAVVVVGTATASFEVAAGSAFGYQQSISLACEDSAPVHCAFDPISIMPGNKSVLTVGGWPESASVAISFRVNGISENQFATLPLAVMIADYSISAATTEVSVVAGGSATFTMAVQSLNGFSQPVSIECGGTPALATCQAIPASITPAASGQGTVLISVATTAPASPPGPVGPGRFPPLRGSWGWLALLSFVCALFVLQNRAKMARRIAWSTAGLFMFLVTACGGGGQSPVVHHPGTPAGKYELKLNATSGELVRSTTVTLRVN